jgi:hypothetical protein
MKLLSSLLIFILLSSCVSYNSIVIPDSNNYKVCESPYFIKTETRSWGEYAKHLENQYKGSYTRADVKQGFTVGQIVYDYQKKYGSELMIQNIRIDYKITTVFAFRFEKPFSATYDLLKCQMPEE